MIIIDWIKSSAIRVSIMYNVMLTIIVLVGILYFIILGKNITVDRSSHSQSTSISSSSSGSIAIGYIGDSVKGSAVDYYRTFNTADDLIVFRQSLSVSQKLLSNITFNPTDKKWYLFYSSFEDTKNIATKTVKTFNGIEIENRKFQEIK